MFWLVFLRTINNRRNHFVEYIGENINDFNKYL